MLEVRVTSNFEDVLFPSPKQLTSEMKRARIEIGTHLVSTAKAKLGTQQGPSRGGISGQSVPGWPAGAYTTWLHKTGKIIAARIKYEIKGETVVFGTTGNARYGVIQNANEFGAKIQVTEAMRKGFKLDDKFIKIKADTIIIPQRSYIRGTVYQLEVWIMRRISTAMKASMRRIGR